VAFIIDDEAAIKCSVDMYRNNLGAIREPSEVKFYLTISTIRPGPHRALRALPNHVSFKGRTADNPYLPAGYEQQLRDAMPDSVAAMELDSEDGELEGRIWTSFDFEAWPNGNMLEGYKFQRGKPWWLVMDLGNHANYTVYQMPEAIDDNDKRILNGRLWVACIEWLSNNNVGRITGKGGLEGILPDIIARCCNDGDYRKNPPQCVFLGHDANTKGIISDKSAAYEFNRLGWEWTFPGGQLSSKEVQLRHLTMMHWERRMCVAGSKNKHGQWEMAERHFHEGKQRGMIDMLERDVYPNERGDVFTKDKSSVDPKHSVEDDRDGMLYGGVCIKHPDTYDASYYRDK
jgi:hypothetical protein